MFNVNGTEYMFHLSPEFQFSLYWSVQYDKSNFVKCMYNFNGHAIVFFLFPGFLQFDNRLLLKYETSLQAD